MGIEAPTQEQLDSPASKIEYTQGGFGSGQNEFTAEGTGQEPALLANVPPVEDEVEESEGLKQAPEPISVEPVSETNPLVEESVSDGEADESKSGEEVSESDEGSVPPLAVEPTVDAEDLSLKVDDAGE